MSAASESESTARAAAIAARVASVRSRIDAAATRAGRRPEDVRLLAASKTFPAADVRAVVAAGVVDVGENYVQEARDKRPELEGLAVRWHLVGTLQRNKARIAAGLFDCVQTLDRIELATSLDRAAAERGRPLGCLVEVRLGGEATKGGVAPEALEGLLVAIGGLSNLRVEGLMAVPPPVATAEHARPYFAELRELRDRAARLPRVGEHLKDLSMGMTADFEVAVEEGATLVRVGTALFGERPKRPA